VTDNLLSVTDLSLRLGGETILEGIDFGVDTGEAVALVGPNGVGKTTLFRVLTGRCPPDQGKISWRREARISHLRQSVEFPEADTPREVAERALADLREAIESFERITDELETVDDDQRIEKLVDRQHALQRRIERGGGWEWQRRLHDAFDRLGMLDWADAPLASLSGGQRRRVGLARVLLEHPDLLLLDEPTNHLDPATIQWLEDWLRDFSGAVLFVSHDRYFLEQVSDRILELDEHDGLFDHPSEYQTFMERKLNRMEIRRRTQQRRLKQIEEELEFLERGVKSQKRQSQDRKRELQKMAEAAKEVDYEQKTIDFDLHARREFGPQILSARNLHVSRGDIDILQGVHFQVSPGDMIGLLGPNGCGKTTLLEVLTDNLRPDAGQVDRGARTDIAYMRQSSLPFDPEAPIFEAFSDSDYVWIGDTRHHKRDYLEQFLFDRQMQRDRVASLSGGQLRRLQLAKIAAQNANLLLLDEPTNDLDIASVHALEEALRQFEGCAIVVSHDRYFLNRVCNTIVAFERNGRALTRYDGDYDDYRQATSTRDADTTETSGNTHHDDADNSQTASTSVDSPLTYAERQELEKMEERIEAAEDRKREIEAKLNDPDFYDSEEHRQEARDLNHELHELIDRIEGLYDRWETLSERAQ